MAEQFSWVPFPHCSPPGCPFPRKTLALSACVSPHTTHFWGLDKSLLSGPGRGPFPASNVNSGGTSSSYNWHPNHLGVLGDQLAHQWTRSSGCNWNLLSLISSWRRQLARVPWLGKEKESDFFPLPCLFPLFNLSYPTLFFFCPGPGYRSRFEGPQLDLSVGAWSSPVGRELEFWVWSGIWSLVGPSSRPPILEAEGKVL